MVGAEQVAHVGEERESQIVVWPGPVPRRLCSVWFLREVDGYNVFFSNLFLSWE